eukprot:TRINITY_DN6696_c0_g1_i1.p1 TRINITY_DN6696_c0_g1~~TRINITY_DN6696_c0_g1_i1.p1  ORF type:complete len:711 (-),score=260.85 TRINITY_DN6696_c0_g1_i1:545-2677(-)
MAFIFGGSPTGSPAQSPKASGLGPIPLHLLEPLMPAVSARKSEPYVFQRRREKQQHTGLGDHGDMRSSNGSSSTRSSQSAPINSAADAPTQYQVEVMYLKKQNQLELDNSSLRRQLDEVQNQLASVKQEYNKLWLKYKGAQSKISNKQSTLLETMEEQNKAEAKAAMVQSSLEREKSTMVREKKKADSDIKMLQGEISTLQNDIKGLQGQIKDGEQKHADMVVDNSKLHSSISELQESLAKEQKAHGATRTKLDDTAKLLEQATQQVADLQLKVAGGQAACDTLQAQLDTERLHHTALRNEHTALEAKARSLEEEVAQLKDRSSSSEAALRSRLSSAEDESRSHVSRVAQLEQQLQASTQSISLIEQELQSTQRAYAQASQKAKLADEAEEAARQATQLGRQLDEANQRIRALEEAKEASRRSMNEALTYTKSLEDAKEGLEKQLAEAQGGADRAQAFRNAKKGVAEMRSRAAAFDQVFEEGSRSGLLSPDAVVALGGPMRDLAVLIGAAENLVDQLRFPGSASSAPAPEAGDPTKVTDETKQKDAQINELKEQLSAAQENVKVQVAKVKKLETEFNEMSELLTEAANKIEEQTQQTQQLEEQLRLPKYDVWLNDNSVLIAVDVAGVSDLQVDARSGDRAVLFTGMLGGYEQASLVEEYSISKMGRLPQESPEFVHTIPLPVTVTGKPSKVHIEQGTAYVTLPRAPRPKS